MFLVGRTDGWFQQAIKDPARNETSRDKQPYKHAGASKKAVPEMAGTHKVTVGAPDAGQRTWELPKALLARHSTLFASLFQDYPNREGTEFPTVSPSDFANLVDYMRSNIYSLNTQVSGFRAIRANTDACLLGIRLEVKNYSDAALIHLHDLFLSFVRLRHSNARLSLIRASDIRYVCDQTSDDSATSTTKSHSVVALKQLFFDAIAAHWTARDILSIGAPSLETPGDTTTWTHVYDEYHDFRVWIVNSATTQDSFRAKYLLPQSKYIGPPASRASSASSDDTIKQEDGSEGTSSREAIQGGFSLRVPTSYPRLF
jgi:hypothetical protein